MLWVELKVGSNNLICGICYRPPGGDLNYNARFLDNLQRCLDKINIQSNSLVTIIGDFNDHYDSTNQSESTDFGCLLYRWMECNNLFQVITEPTRITQHGATILDLITNCPGYFVHTGILSPPSNCDHSVIFAKMSITFIKQKSYKRFVWDFNNVNESEFCNALVTANLDVFTSHNDIKSIYENWFTGLYNVIESHICHKFVTIRPPDKSWMNNSIRRAIRRRNRLFKIHVKKRTGTSWDRYRPQRNLTTSLIRSNKKKYFSNLNERLQDSSTSSKSWWGIVKSLYGAIMQMSIPTLIEGARYICCSKEKSELFNDYFYAQNLIDDSCAILPSNISYFQTTITLSNIYASEREINNLLKSVDTSKACGCDGIGNKILKLCANGITTSFTSIVNLSLLSGSFPDQWKLANVIPIFKKGDRQSKLNYRPVSLLDLLSKIFEKIVYIRLYNFLSEIFFLNPLQSGFRPDDSTVNQLICLVHKIYDALERGKEVRMVFLDISMAFDKVWHKGLLYKLETIGVRDPLLGWFKSYLTNGKHRVVIDGQFSEWKNIKAGVPHGSVLGPLLFLIISMILLKILKRTVFFTPMIPHFMILLKHQRCLRLN